MNQLQKRKEMRTAAQEAGMGSDEGMTRQQQEMGDCTSDGGYESSEQR